MQVTEVARAVEQGALADLSNEDGSGAAGIAMVLLTAATPVGSAGASLMLGPDGFFDGAIFDPDEIDRYIAAQERPADQG